MPELTSGQNKAVTDYHWTDWLNLFWSHRDGRPVCYQFWFIRDLFVVMLLSPLLHLLLRRLRWAVVGLFGLLWVSMVGMPFPASASLPFLLLGCLLQH